MAAAQDADEWAGCGEAGMGSEVHEGLRWDGVMDGKGKSGLKGAGWWCLLARLIGIWRAWLGIAAIPAAVCPLACARGRSSGPAFAYLDR